VLPPFFPLQSLRVLEVCARHCNFTRAAEELSVTTTAVSQRIRDLERRLGVPLFRRHGPQLALTEAGASLSQSVRQALGILSGAVANCSAARPSLRVTCVPTFANRWLLSRLHEYHQQPGSASIMLDISTELRRHDEFDIAIRSGVGPWPPLEGVPLLQVEGTPLLSPKLARDLTKDPASLAALPLIPDQRWPSWFRLAGLPASGLEFTAAEYPTQDAVATAAINGGGVALLSPSLFAEQLASGALIAPFEQTLYGPGAYWLLWRDAEEAAGFVEWLRTQFAEVGSRAS
jgi:LysR family glycine cleavage system transcriptional activator